MKKSILLLVFILSAYIVHGAYGTIPTFYGQEETFNVSITESMSTTQYLRIPLYADMLNLNISGQYYPNNLSACTQWGANESASCAPTTLGNYTFSRPTTEWTTLKHLFDNDDATYTVFIGVIDNGFIYANYTNEKYQDYNATLRIRYGQPSNGVKYFPIPNACMTGNMVTLRYGNVVADERHYIHCYVEGTGTYTAIIEDLGGQAGYKAWYDDAVIWSRAQQNITMSIGDEAQPIFIVNQTTRYYGFNMTVLNQELSSCDCTDCSTSGLYCNMPIGFYGEESSGDLTTSITYSNYSYGVGDCASPYWNYTVMNVSYYDENTLSAIQSSNAYELQVSSPFTQSLSNILSADYTHSFCTNKNTSAIGYNISIYGTMNIQSEGYDNKIIETDEGNGYIVETQPYYPLDIYLTDTGNSSVVTFTIKDSLTKTLIDGAQVKMYQLYNGTYNLAEQKLSDATGKVVFTYIQNKLYHIEFSKEGYNLLAYDFNPISSSSYTIYMARSVIQNQTQTFDRVIIDWEPDLFYDGNNTFSIRFFSAYDEFNSYSYNLSYPGGSISDSGTQASGETMTSNITISTPTSYDRVQLDIEYNSDIAGTRQNTYYFEIVLTPGLFTIIKNKDTTYGLGLFERIFISVFAALLILGIATLTGQQIPGLCLSLCWLWIMTRIEFIPLWPFLVSTFVSITLMTGRSD